MLAERAWIAINNNNNKVALLNRIKNPSQSDQPSGEKHKKLWVLTLERDLLLYPWDRIVSSRCAHKTQAGSRGRAMSHTENTALWLCIAAARAQARLFAA